MTSIQTSSRTSARSFESSVACAPMSFLHPTAFILTWRARLRGRDRERQIPLLILMNFADTLLRSKRTLRTLCRHRKRRGKAELDVLAAPLQQELSHRGILGQTNRAVEGR